MACGDARSIVTCEDCRFKDTCKLSDYIKDDEMGHENNSVLKEET